MERRNWQNEARRRNRNDNPPRRYDEYDNMNYNQDDYQTYGQSRGYDRRDIDNYSERDYRSRGYGRYENEERSWNGPYDEDRGWRGYPSNDRMSGRGYRESQNIERQFQGRPGYGRGGYETGYGQRGMSRYQGEYGDPYYRSFDEDRRRSNRGGYESPDNDYDSWNVGNYGSRWESERDHYGYNSNPGSRRRGFRNW